MKPGNELIFLALGGSGEIGMNVNLYGTQGKWVMVDLGLTFGGTDYPGIDLVLPDLSFIEDRKKDLLEHGLDIRLAPPVRVRAVLDAGRDGRIPFAKHDLDVKFHKRSAVGPARRTLLQERRNTFGGVFGPHQIAQV